MRHPSRLPSLRPIAAGALALSLSWAATPATPEPAMTDAPLALHADRNPPPPVSPILREGIRYEHRIGSEGIDPQVGGLLTACEAATGRALWTLAVYDNRRDPMLEGDVQDVFFREMHFEPDGSLLVVNERGDRFRVDVKARTSTPLGGP
jgi:hypothetical protein